jgi:general secretion pathway protein H
MRILAPGTSATSPPLRGAGFTLVEILVVLLIIGVMIAGAALSVKASGGDRDLERERDRIHALTDYLRDQAALENREYGMRCYTGGYEFLVFDARNSKWVRLEADSATRPRKLPVGINMTLRIEGHVIVLPEAEVEEDELAPQILLFSSGDLNLFELTLQREGGAGVSFKPSSTSERIDITELAAEPS